MRFRKLRIAWSVAWGIAAVLLCVLWLLSYWNYYDVTGVIAPHNFQLISDDGRLLCIYDIGDFGDDRITWLKGSLVDRNDLRYLAAWEHVPFEGEASASLSAGFCAGQTVLGYAVMVPHWFAVFTICALGALLWIPWSTQFSLHALLIATTLVTVVLGLIVWLRSS